MFAGRNPARLFLAVVGLQLGAYSLAAQCGGGLNSADAPYCPDCPPPCYAVSVAPDAQPLYAVADHDTTVGFTLMNVGNTTDAWDLTCSTTGNLTCQNVQPGSYLLGAGQSATIWVTLTAGPLGTSGMLYLRAYSLRSSDSGSFSVSNVGAKPVVSLAPYSAGYSSAADGATHVRSLPAFGSMGVARTLALAYNSAAARPVSLVTFDVSNAKSPYPITYQVQVQLASNGVYLQLMNGATSVYYAAATTTTTRMVAAIDAKANGLATGWYPVNVIVTANYAVGSRATTVSSRLLVNDQTGSAFSAGVGLAGIPRLYAMAGSYSLLLVDGGGGLSYFDRTCAACAFVSPAGESGTLAVYNDPTLGPLYRLTALDQSIWDFRTDGRPARHFVLASIQDLTLAWTDTLLTSVKDTSGRGFTLSYAAGKLAQVRDAAGRVTAVSIVSGQLVKVTDPDGLLDSLSYDANSFLTRVTDRAGGVWNYGYNALNQLTSVTAPAAVDYSGATVRPTGTSTTSDLVVWQPGIPGASASAPKGNVKPDTVMMSVTDPLGNVTRVALDRFGLATKVVDALGQVTTVTRDTLGNAKQILAPNGHAITRNYIGYLLTSESDNATGQSRSYNYNPSKQLQSVTGGPARLDYYYHDGTQGPPGTLKMVYAGNTAPPGAGPSGGTVAAQYFPNAYGQDTLVVDGGDHRTRTVYATAAAGGNPLQFIDPKGHVTSYHYNSYGLVDTTTLVTGAKRAVSYDIMNRVTVSVNELGYATQYFYNRLGLTRIQDPKGKVYIFDLNAWGLTVARHDLGDTTKVDSLKYDAGGNVRTVRTRRGDVITMTYDLLGRLLTRSGPDFPQEYFTYGLNGAWVVAANANGRDSIVSDQAGRPTFASQQMPDGTTTYQLSYTYDSHSRLVSRSAPAGGNIARWVYNSNLATLDSLCGAGACARITRDAETKPQTITYSSGQTGAWSHVQVFDSLHMVTRDSFTVGQLENSLGTRWVYDSLARLRSRSRSYDPFGALNSYSYDAAGQVVNACFWDGMWETRCLNEYGRTGNAYGYDSAGNRTDTLASAVIGAGNRVQQWKGYAVAYDPNGAVVQKAGGDTTLLQWNAVGQVTRVEKWPAGGAHTVTMFLYDALGRRVSKTVNGVTTWFVYDGDQVVMDVDATSHATVAEYGFFPGLNNLFAMRTASSTGVALKDPVTHTVMAIAAAQGGAVIKSYGVPTSPWGQVASDTGTVVRFRMGGQEFDQETGLYHLGARYYDPQLGRFLSEDPLGVADGLNQYSYAGNDPVNGRDPTGLAMTLDGGGGGGDGGMICWYFTYSTSSQATVTAFGETQGGSFSVVHTVTMCSGGGGVLEGGPGGDGGGKGWGSGGGGGGGGSGPAGQSLGQQGPVCPWQLDIPTVSNAIGDVWRTTVRSGVENGAFVLGGGLGGLTVQGLPPGQTAQLTIPTPLPAGVVWIIHSHPNAGPVSGRPGWVWQQAPSDTDLALGDRLQRGMIVVSRDSFFLREPGGPVRGCARP